MDTPRYKAGMYLKQDPYMRAGKRLVSLYPADKDRLDQTLAPRLARLACTPLPDATGRRADDPRRDAAESVGRSESA